MYDFIYSGGPLQHVWYFIHGSLLADNVLVAPRAGAGMNRYRSASHPERVRGLELVTFIGIPLLLHVAPRAGAGIGTLRAR